MPKRIGFLYECLIDKEYIRECIKIGVKKKKKSRYDISVVLNNVDEYVERFYEKIKNFDYTPTVPKVKTIYDKCSQKERELSIQPFNKDGIIHQMVTEQLKPIVMRSMYHWSCGSIPDRGGKRMLYYNKRMVQRKTKNSKYVAELDIKHYYPSIPLKKVMSALERKIKDRKFLILVAIIISNYQGGLKYAIENNISPYDIVGDKVGISIGAVTSQWIGNYYLESLDRFICSLDGVYCHSRNMDNIIISARNKRKLHRALDAINEFMRDVLGVEMKGDWQIFRPNKRMVSTVGYRIGRDRVIMRKRNFLRLARQSRRAKKLSRARKKIPVSMAQGLISRAGQLKHCNGRNVFEKYIKPLGVKRLKSIIREDARRRNALMKGATA